MYGRIIYDSQRLFINGTEVNGVQSVETSSSISVVPISVAGTGFLYDEIESKPENSLNASRLLTQKPDFITGLFNNFLDGTLAYKKSSDDSYMYLSFTSGRLSSYDIKCAVGQIASSDIGIKVYGDMGSGFLPHATGADTQDIFIAKPGDLIIDLPAASTNRVQSINYSLNIEEQEKPYIGTISGVSELKTTEPITIEVEFSLDVDDYQSKRVFETLCDSENIDLNFRFENCLGNTGRCFSAPNAKLQSVNTSSDIGTDMNFTLKYISYVNNINDIKIYLSQEIS